MSHNNCCDAWSDRSRYREGIVHCQRRRGLSWKCKLRREGPKRAIPEGELLNSDCISGVFDVETNKAEDGARGHSEVLAKQKQGCAASQFEAEAGVCCFTIQEFKSLFCSANAQL
jgi:hypothetical protein